MKFRGKAAIGIGLLAVLMSAGAAFAAPADDVKALLDKGDAAGAYALGRNHPDQLGNPQFDFYFGVAAKKSGRASRAFRFIDFGVSVNCKLSFVKYSAVSPRPV